MKELKIDEPKGIEITAVKFSMRCKMCGHTWGVVLNQLGQIPYHGDRCISCWRKRLDEISITLEAEI